MKIIWSPLSIERTANIAEYIALDNPEIANEWIDKLFHFVEKLTNFPKRGRIVAEINDENIRELIFGNYRIIYQLQKNQISIMTIRHTKQILPESDI